MFVDAWLHGLPQYALLQHYLQRQAGTGSHTGASETGRSPGWTQLANNAEHDNNFCKCPFIDFGVHLRDRHEQTLGNGHLGFTGTREDPGLAAIEIPSRGAEMAGAPGGFEE